MSYKLNLRTENTASHMPIAWILNILLFLLLAYLHCTTPVAAQSSDYDYYYNYSCQQNCTDFGSDSAGCLASCDTCGFDTLQRMCIFISVPSWGCPDVGDNVIVGGSVSNDCVSDAITVCDQFTGGFFIANCVSGGVFFFTFWAFVWVARSNDRYTPIMRAAVMCGLLNIAAFILLAVLLYVYSYCNAAKAIFIVTAVVSVICWIITVFNSCGCIGGSDDESKALEMGETEGHTERTTQVQLKQIQIAHATRANQPQARNNVNGAPAVPLPASAVAATTAGSPPLSAGTATDEDVIEIVDVADGVHPEPERRSDSGVNSQHHGDSLSHQLSNYSQLSRQSSPPVIALDADGHTPPYQFTATIA